MVTTIMAKQKIGAVASLDPAGVGPGGIAVRLTKRLELATSLGYPDHVYSGWLFEPQAMDELCEFLATNLPADESALIVVENSAYRSYHVARHIGRGIGAVEAVLHHCGLADASKSEYVTPAVYRKAVLVTVPKDRAAIKKRSIEYVREQYGQDVDDNLADAIVLNDYMSHKMFPQTRGTK